MQMLRQTAIPVVLSASLAASGCAPLLSPTVARFEPSRAATHRGLERFVFDDFGLLDPGNRETGTLPWKLAATALVLSEAKSLGLPPDRGALIPVVRQFGIVVPDSIANWPSDAAPEPGPGVLGQTRGTARSRVGGLEIELRSPGCPLCHAGVLYDAAGRPSRSAWLGVPNGSLQLDELNRTLFAAIRAAMQDERALLQAMRRVFPGVSTKELRTYERVVLPRVRRRLAETEATRDRLLLFENGGAGTVNNVAARLMAAGAIPARAFRDEQTAITSIPILSNRAFRSSLMCDGSYATPGAERFVPVSREQAEARGSLGHAALLAVFSIGESGTHPARVPRQIASFREVATALDELRAPSFPSLIDRRLATTGGRVFQERCSSCHGDYEMRGERPTLRSFPNRLVPVESIGTDRERAEIAASVVTTMRDSARARPAFAYADIAPTFGYVAPILDGLWITAPYLHNGSVPTLWHLMHPGERPTTFEVGGHLLDYERMGIGLVDAHEAGAADDPDDHPGSWRHLRFPADWTPRSRSSIYDTRLRGRSNEGHESPFNRMRESEKRAVLEFLKLL